LHLGNSLLTFDKPLFGSQQHPGEVINDFSLKRGYALDNILHSGISLCYLLDF
jgi:hypothetical protein